MVYYDFAVMLTLSDQSVGILKSCIYNDFAVMLTLSDQEEATHFFMQTRRGSFLRADAGDDWPKIMFESIYYNLTCLQC